MSKSPHDKIRDLYGGRVKWVPSPTRRHPRRGWYRDGAFLGATSEEVICSSPKWQAGGGPAPAPGDDAVALARALPAAELLAILREREEGQAAAGAGAGEGGRLARARALLAVDAVRDAIPVVEKKLAAAAQAVKQAFAGNGDDAGDVAPAKKPKRRAKKAAAVEAPPAAGPACPADQEECAFGLLGGACGLPAPLFLAGAAGPQKQPARYCLTDARRLIPSHDPLRSFTPRPEYPPDTQERVYQQDKAEQAKVRTIAAELRPEIVFMPAADGINGPPIATEQGIVLGGNGRSMGLQLHYAEGGTAARDYLLQIAPLYGFTRAQVEALEQPVVVRVLRAPGKDLARLVRLLNVPLTQGMDARAEAVGEARRLSEDVLQVLAAHLGEDTTLSEYLSSRASADFVAALKRSEVITSRNANKYLTADGLLNEDGRQLVERLLAAALLPDAPLLDALGAQTRGVLARGAPYLLAAAAAGPAWDLRPALRAAATDLVELRRREAHSVSEYLRQDALLAEARPAIDGVPLGREVLEVLYQLGGKPLVFARLCQRYARDAAYTPAGQSMLFAAEALSPAEALRQAAAAAGVKL